MAAVADLDRTTYYQILDVPADAGGDAIRDAYYRLVRVAHPDRHAREPDERRRAVVRYYARIGEAWRVLSTPTSRKTYDEALGRGASRLADTARRAAPPKDPSHRAARDLYERGMALVAAGDGKGAKVQLDMALAFEPGSNAIQEALASLASATAPQPGPAPAVRAEGSAPAPPAVSPAPHPGPPPASRGEGTIAPAPPAASPAPHPGPPPASRGEGAIAPAPGEGATAPPAAIRLRCSSRAQLADFCRKNLRAGHLSMPTARPLPAGARVRVLLTLPDGITAELDAVAIDPPASGGARVQFAPLSPDRRAILAALLDDPSVLPSA